MKKILLLREIEQDGRISAKSGNIAAGAYTSTFDNSEGQLEGEIIDPYIAKRTFTVTKPQRPLKAEGSRGGPA